MEDEFDKLMEIFSEEANSKEKKLEEIFQKSAEFFEKYKDVIAKGSLEEKSVIQKKMNLLREKLKVETEESYARLGISEGEVKALAENPKNFTPKQWDFLQNAKEKMFQEKNEQEKKIEVVKKNRIEELKEKKKKKPTGRKSGWMKS